MLELGGRWLIYFKAMIWVISGYKSQNFQQNIWSNYLHETRQFNSKILNRFTEIELFLSKYLRFIYSLRFKTFLT